MSDEASSKFEKLIATLGDKLQLTGREIADILWLAQQYQTTTDENAIARRNNETITATEEKKPDNTKTASENTTTQTPTSPQKTEPQAPVYAKSTGSTSKSTSGNTLDIKVPDALGLRQPLKLIRAIRPLIQKIDSETELILDEEATANHIAREGIRIPIFKPRLQPAFDLMLVVDESSTMIFWRKAIQELQQLFQVLGAFRDVQVWGLLTDNENIYLRRGIGKKAGKNRYYHPRSLVDPSGKRLILVASDCVADIWHNGKAFAMLQIWTKTNTVAIIQMLPQWLWQRTGLSLGAKVQFSSLTPRIVNQDLLIKKILLWDDIDFATGTKIPIFTLEEESAKTWSKMIAGRSDAHVTGFVFSLDSPQEDYSTEETQEIDAEEITSNFRRTSSPIARKLASLLSAAPIINLPIVRIIQAQMLPQSQQVHVAEVFLGGIIKRKPQENLSPNLSPTRKEALDSPPSSAGNENLSPNLSPTSTEALDSPPSSAGKENLSPNLSPTRKEALDSPPSSAGKENLSPNLSPTSTEALTSPPSSAGKENLSPNLSPTRKEALTSPPSSAGNENLSPNLSPTRKEALTSPPSSAGKENLSPNLSPTRKEALTSPPSSVGKENLSPNLSPTRKEALDSPPSSVGKENLSPNLSPTSTEALDSPPSLAGKGAGGLGFSTPQTNPDDIEFEFINENVRNNFLDAAPVSDSLEIIEEISKYFAKKLGKTLSEFNALLRKPQLVDDENQDDIKPFALLSAKVLKRLGGDYIEFAEDIERDWENQTSAKTKTIPLTDFTFETVTVNRRGEIINQETKTAQYFTENIPPSPITSRGVGGEVIPGNGGEVIPGNGGEVIPLEMVYIPGGTFMMGTPEGEGDNDEKPQHKVTVPPFFMGKYLITQEQWKAVANLPQVERELKPEPSYFKGEDNQKNNFPLEQVSWYSAEEFCKRLSQHTGKQYRLPSEAEWEYACRAGTTTPFHFGETITGELASYNASRTFADEPKSEYRQTATTPVGHFPPNAFGLHDMHGNIWE